MNFQGVTEQTLSRLEILKSKNSYVIAFLTRQNLFFSHYIYSDYVLFLPFEE